jgi:glycine/serine hydroxymethyltransferase
MRQIAKWIAEALAHREDPAALNRVRAGVLELCRQYPAPHEA